LIQSEIALRTVSIQSPSLAEVVDKGLEKVQKKNNVGQKLHKRTLPFIDGWIKKHGLQHGHSIKLQTAEGFPLLLKPPYGTMTSEADKNKNADCFSAIGIGQ